MPRSKARRTMARRRSVGASAPKFCHRPSEIAGSNSPLCPVRLYGRFWYRSLDSLIAAPRRVLRPVSTFSIQASRVVAALPSKIAMTETGGTKGMGLIVFLIVGGLAGFMASKVLTGRGMGLIWDIVVGIL